MNTGNPTTIVTTARVTPDEDRAKILDLFIDYDPRFATYLEKTNRKIPVVVFDLH